MKLWGAITQFTGIKPLSEFYLSPDSSLDLPWAKYLQDIEGLGFNKIGYDLNLRTVYNESHFREKAFRAISGLKDRYDDREDSMNLRAREHCTEQIKNIS